MIIVGDLHLKETEPYRTAALSFIDWLIENHSGPYVFTGDFIDNQTIHIEKTLKPVISKLQGAWICAGNHDSNLRGSLLSLSSEIKFVQETSVFTIDQVRTAFYPYSRTPPEYLLKADLHIAHFAPPWYRFDFDNARWPEQAGVIYGHVHDHETRGQSIIIGTPYPTNYAERNNKCFIYDTEKGLIDVPDFIHFEEIEVNEKPKSGHPRILTINGATSREEIETLYPDEYIHWPSCRMKAIKEQKTQSVIDLRTFCAEFEMPEEVRKEILLCL